MWSLFVTLMPLACTPEAPPRPPPPVAAPEAVEAPVVRAPPREAPNQPPIITRVELSPLAPTVTDSIRATVAATDPEGVLLDLDFEWYISDQRVLTVSGDRLPAGKHRKGDTIRVSVSARDDSETVTKDGPVLTVVNTKPVFRTAPREVTRIDGFQFRADDIDADALTWRLEHAPPGMSISDRGVLRYKGTEDEPGGAYTVSVFADDGDGFGRFDIPLQISPGSRAASKLKAKP